MKVHVPVVRCPTCATPYVLRWSFSLSGHPTEYLFQRDCKHKTPPPPMGTDAVDEIETALLLGPMGMDS